MGYEVTVTNIGETRLLDPRNQPIRAYRFTFMVGNHGPFTQDFSAQELSDGTAKVKLQQFANQLAAAAS